MPRYLIDFGNSTDGPVGAVLRLTARTPEAALRWAQTHIPERLSEPFVGGRQLNVYFNTGAITLADVSEEDEAFDPNAPSPELQQALDDLYKDDKEKGDK